MAYNLLDLRTRVRAKIKDSAYSASTIDGFINDAIVEIADVYPFKQFQKVVSGALTVGEYVYAQQSDHQTTNKLVLVNVAGTAGLDITEDYMNSEEFFEEFPAPDVHDNSFPAFWTEYGNQIYFNCPVDAAYELRQFYQKIPKELSADADVPELPQNFREAIVLGASYRCEEERGNYDIAAVLQNRFNDRVGDLILRFANDTIAAPDTVVIPGRE